MVDCEKRKQNEHHRQAVAAQQDDLGDVVAVGALIVGGGHRQNAGDTLDDDGVEHHIRGGLPEGSIPVGEQTDEGLPEQVDKARSAEYQQIQKGEKAVGHFSGPLLHIGGNNHRRNAGGEEREEKQNDVVGEIVGIHFHGRAKGGGGYRGLEQRYALGGHGQHQHQHKMPGFSIQQ